LGIALMAATICTLIVYLWNNQRNTLFWIAGIYLSAITVELLFSKRRILFKKNND